MWAAYFQEVEGHRWTIAVKKLRHQAEYECEKFVARMTNPEVGIWWTWVEEVADDELERQIRDGD